MMQLATNLSASRLDPRDLTNNDLLRHLQGNILKGHGRDNTVHMLVWFDTANPQDVKKWIGSFAEEKITSFKEQLRQRELFRRNGVSGGLFAGLYLTARFYRDFGFDLSKFGQAEAFCNGMKSRTDLQDVDTYLEDVYKQGTTDGEGRERKFIHAMILLAHADLIALNKAAHEVCEALGNFKEGSMKEEGKENKIAEVITTEYGAAIRNANGDGLEHFGYVDGISQPLFLKEDLDEYERNNLPNPVFDASAPLSLVLVPDPLAEVKSAYGSYFVYRKLEQNVRGFKEAEKALGKQLFPDGDDEEREIAGAMIIGRFEDGTPVTLSDEDKMISSGILNNFDYTGSIDGKGPDGAGARCPFHGHIRKTNPRTADEQGHRMARRGITYGHRNVSTTVEQSFVQMPSDGVGLLFMSFQSSIENQFEYIQKEANAPRNRHQPAGTADTGVDLLIGPANGNRVCSYARTYDEGGSVKPAKEAFGNFIRLKGGEYFFAPSVAWLKAIVDFKSSTLKLNH